jgi:hypothetical protein
VQSSGCNGHPELCDRAYDDVSYVTTHNAFNYAFGPEQYFFPNQNTPISTQLENGVRAFMIDIHEYNGFDSSHDGEIFVCHSYCWLGGEPLENVLNTFFQFMIENPEEVITLILESYVSFDQIEPIFEDTGLIQYVHPQSSSAAWPTLQELIELNERLVVFTDRDGGAADWYLDVWDFAVETNYSAKTADDFTCDYNRGDPSNSLFILNHFITWIAGTRYGAHQVNYNPYLIDRAEQCQTETGKLPNFLTVDFNEIGDVFEAVDMLNGVE